MKTQRIVVSRALSWMGLLGMLSVALSTGNAASLEIDLSKSGPPIPPTFYGLMTEEINHSYDGGLYAELIQNRTFQDPHVALNGTVLPDKARVAEGAPIHWAVIGSGKVSTVSLDPVNAALPISLRVELSGSMGGVGNDGYWGIPIRPDTTYTASFYAKAHGGFAGPVTASLVVDSGGTTMATADTQPLTGQWKKYVLALRTASDAPTTAAAHFVLSATGDGGIDFSLISLFPPTFNDAPNGLRPDLMKLMADMHPKFIRLPGGNYVEGNRFSDRFNWKKMIGPVEQRPGHMGCWSYRSSDGFGLPEYLLWCKQLGAEPVLAVFAGYTLNGDHFNAGSPEMAIYTEEALQEIEYVNGSADSEWGKRRVADGFPEPFPLHYVEIGNEDWFDPSGSYDGRFTEIAQAIRARYPALKLIATAPVSSSRPDLYDDHMYAGARATQAQFNKYDAQTQPPTPKHTGGAWNGRYVDGIKTFVGEWATQDGRPTPTLRGALADAVYFMGLERNSDAVAMECYAPLLANINPADKAKDYPRGWQWETNLIGYDALRSFGSPSYHVLAMFGQNKGDFVVPVKFDVPRVEATLDASPHGAVGVGTYQTESEYKDIMVTGLDGQELTNGSLTSDPKRWQYIYGDWSVRDGTLKPADESAQTWAITGDRNWQDYTIRLRARKLRGKEGFLVLWHAADGDNYRWWNIGGWNNTLTRCESAQDGEREGYGPGSAFTVETGRWYDLRLEIKGHHARGYIDDKLVMEAADEPRALADSAYASASYANASHELMVKVVNTGAIPLATDIRLRGANRIGPTGKATVLTGDLGAVNTVDKPTNVHPEEEIFTNAAASFNHTFPPHSVSMLRFPAE